MAKAQNKTDPDKRAESEENILNIHYLPRTDRYEMGKKMRKNCPRTSHATWKPPKGRHDPVDLIMESDKGRIPKLVPLRHGRMARSPFTFYRGAALNMAADLDSTASFRNPCASMRRCSPVQFRRIRYTGKECNILDK